jgi:sugar lactone lactonase YvrE
LGRSLLVTLGAFVVLAATAAAKSVFPETIPLPDGFRPEGISIGDGATFYVGSIPTGAIYRGDLRTGEGSVFIPGASDGSRAAIGLGFDRGLLYVSGGGTGKAFVYDVESGELVREVELADPADGLTFINDVVVTKDAAYFTDSRRAVFYRLALANDGTPSSTADAVELSGDFEFVEGQLNLNGIEATANGKTLVAVQTANGRLYRIDPDTGEATTIDLGGAAVPMGDGLLLDGRTLYVVRNFANAIAVVELEPDLASGVVTETITNPGRFAIPTTIDRFGSRLYVVNARFDVAPTPTTPYTVVQVDR